MQVLVNTNVLNQSITVLTQRLINIYNLGAVSSFCENSLSLPALCILLFEQTKRYTVPVVPETKTDTGFVPQLLIAEASLMVYGVT